MTPDTPPSELSRVMQEIAAPLTCLNCGKAMRHNVPRMGPAGGYVHAETGSLECAPQAQPTKRAAVTKEHKALATKIYWEYEEGTPEESAQIVADALAAETARADAAHIVVDELQRRCAELNDIRGRVVESRDATERANAELRQQLTMDTQRLKEMQAVGVKLEVENAELNQRLDESVKAYRALVAHQDGLNLKFAQDLASITAQLNFEKLCHAEMGDGYKAMEREPDPTRGLSTMTPTAKRIYEALFDVFPARAQITHFGKKEICAIMDRELAPLIAEVEKQRACKQAWAGITGKSKP